MTEFPQRPVLDSRLETTLYAAFYFGVLFPYIRVTPLATDVQPIALAAAILIVLGARRPRIPRVLAPLLLLVAAAGAISVVYGFGGAAVRSLGNYVSVVVIAVAAFTVIDAHDGLWRRFVEGAALTWGVVGALQTVVSRSFMTFLLSGARTTEGRGVVGLAPEPTSYGIHCLLMMLLVIECESGRRRSRLLWFLAIQVVLFARSSLAILVLLIWGILFAITHLGSARVWLFTAVAAAVVIMVAQTAITMIPALAHIRVFALARLISSNPGLLLARDASASDRASAIVFSLYGFVQAWGLPHGFVQWREFVHAIAPSFARVIPYYSVGDRIMSGYGAALFELGALGLMLPAAVTIAVARAYPGARRRAIEVAGVLHVVFLMALPLGYPLVGFFLGYFAYRAASYTPAPEAPRAIALPDPMSPSGTLHAPA